MSIIISQHGKNAKKIDKSNFEKEGYLQDYIHKNPDSIPIYEIEEDKKLFVVAREFSTESGPIDALAIDKDGDIYIVETKLYKNSDKRTVVAQALDYGASLWKHMSDFNWFMDTLDDEVKDKFSLSFQDKTKEFFDIEDEQYEILEESMRRNLFEGNLKFVILMDEIDERLKDLIIYINQNSQFDIYAVQLEYYKYEDYEIMIPKLFGAEVKKGVGTSSNRTARAWNKDEFLKDARNKIKDENTFNILSELYDFTEKSADKLDFGTGSDSGSITYKFEDDRAKRGLVSIYTIWSRGTIRFRFDNMKKRIGEKNVRLYFNKLKNVIPPKNWNEKMLNTNGPAFFLSEIFKDKKTIELFKNTIVEYVDEIKNER